MAKNKSNSELKKDTKKKEGIGGLMIPVGLFIGMGIGFMYGNLPAWLFIGLGAGFIGLAIVSVIEKNK
ncbi:MAG: hypothetical protein PHV16_05205 [Candidatus Nanoarchaeia archaeon]|nr:hypothetical protein [Candidatus Nanoarchaeia archaeon]